jgi:hypothetical protein
MNPDLDADKQALLLASEELAALRTKEAEEERAAAADGAVVLPEASKELLRSTGRDPPAPAPGLAGDHAADDAADRDRDSDLVRDSAAARGEHSSDEGNHSLDLHNPTCRNSVANGFGQVIGQVLGDCIEFNSSAQLQNAVELCIPLVYGIDDLANSTLGETHGVVLDFARREVVPYAYNVTKPWYSAAASTIPGVMGPLLLQWKSNLTYGRLLPGWSRMSPLAMNTTKRWGGGSEQLCAKVYHSGWAYCPIARLNLNSHFPLPLDGEGNHVSSLDSGCPDMDMLLAHAGGTSLGAVNSTYVPLDMQVVDPRLLQKRQQELARPQDEARQPATTSTSASCPEGHCLAFIGRGFRVVPKDSGQRCHIDC